MLQALELASHGLRTLHEVDDRDDEADEAAGGGDDDEGEAACDPTGVEPDDDADDERDESGHGHDQHGDEVVTEELHRCSLRGVNLAVRVEPCGLGYYRIKTP